MLVSEAVAGADSFAKFFEKYSKNLLTFPEGTLRIALLVGTKGGDTGRPNGNRQNSVP